MAMFDDDFLFGPLQRLLDAIARHVKDPTEFEVLEQEVESVTGIPLDVIDSMPVESAVEMFMSAGRIDAPKAALVGTALRRRGDAYREAGSLLKSLRARKAGEALVAEALKERPDLADVGVSL
jgi:hypothetical protein